MSGKSKKKPSLFEKAMTKVFGDQKNVKPGYRTYRTVLHMEHYFSSPDAMRDILKQDIFESPSLVRHGLESFAPGNLLSVEGARWEFLRAKMIAPFAPAKIDKEFPAIVSDELARVSDTWRAADQVIDVEKSMRTLTVRTIVRQLFEINPSDEDTRTLMEAADYVAGHARITRLTVAATLLGMNFSNPARLNRQDRAELERSDAVFDRIIAQKRQSPGEDIVSRLIEAKDPKTGKPLDDKTIKSQMMLMLVAGHETTAFTLTMALHHILRNPETLQRLRAEDEQACLKYAGYVFLETLRLHPPVAAIPRRASKSVTVDGVKLAKGAFTVVAVNHLHSRQDIFSSAKKFRPERYEENPDALKSLMPFSAGRRGCPGRSIALTEGAMILASIARGFDMEVVHAIDPSKITHVLTARLSTGKGDSKQQLLLKVTPRQESNKPQPKSGACPFGH